MSERDIDAEFDAIVAHWDDDADRLPKPQTVQDITTAYTALSRSEPTAPEPDAATDAADGDGDGDADADAQSDLSDVTAPHAGPPAVTEPTALGAGTTPDEAGAPGAWRAGPSIDDEDDHFEPGPVQLPPGEDLGYWGAIVGLVGGPLLMVWIAVTGPFYRGWWILGSIVLFLGGFGLLVMRQPKHRNLEDDDGARV
ncbi:hypothetical protein [Knoellia subterranea]|uniref:DUF308 domain-containing protein n=1 Tax=Knoellia subterranea KCTC 19937 TaxID=1385521 RepID=A0A0A0JN34_9MICO|nr:hypothetical protein [Knoellia subterranea]KGN38860.1 hypothetical protein N803_07010 [Knoellia subterranea KCTC 19937]